MHGKHWRIGSCLTVALCLVTALAPARRASAARNDRTLPAEVESAIRQAFPEATIRSFGRERENGVLYYEVNLSQDDKRMEVEVSPDGLIGEIEAKVALADVPEDVQPRIVAATRGMRIRRIELHERRGRAEGGKFVPLASPTIKYEVKYFDGRKNRSVMIPAGLTVKLSKEAAAALAKAFPKARLVTTMMQRQGGVKIYEVSLASDGELIDVLISPKGMIVVVKNGISMGELPAAIADVVTPAANDGQVSRITAVHANAIVRSRRLVKLDPPLVTYEVELDMGETGAWFQFAAAGTVLDKAQWRKDDDRHHDDGDDDNDDDNDDDDNDDNGHEDD